MTPEKTKEQLLASYDNEPGAERAKKLAVIFPGIGYRTDKPLLYYAASLARAHGYVIREVHYRGFPEEIRKTNTRGRKELMDLALAQTKELLRAIPVRENGELLFISKSVGTAVACDFASSLDRRVRHVLYTPLEETPLAGVSDAIAFHGTRDNYVRTGPLSLAMKEHGLRFHVFEGANHSLETGDALKDISILSRVMKLTAAFLSSDT
ncbi:MAG: alpha/beta hydrolase [Lachnospiraceae bacterium]|nr:alpha/beta hydrolase [Lachnospiraceae bacterium]